MRRGAALAVALAAALGLAGCGSVAERISERASEAPGIGLPSGAPERPVTPVAYPAVHDMPPARPAALMNEAEQERVERELLAARARNQAAAGLPITPEPERPPKKPAETQPAPAAGPGGRPIY